MVIPGLFSDLVDVETFDIRFAKSSMPCVDATVFPFLAGSVFVKDVASAIVCTVISNFGVGGGSCTCRIGYGPF